MTNLKLIKLFKDGCDPCTKMANFLEDNNISGIESVNVMKNIDLAIKYGVMSVPVLLLVDDEGNEVTRTFGYKPSEILELVDKRDCN